MHSEETQGLEFKYNDECNEIYFQNNEEIKIDNLHDEEIKININEIAKQENITIPNNLSLHPPNMNAFDASILKDWENLKLTIILSFISISLLLVLVIPVIIQIHH